MFVSSGQFYVFIACVAFGGGVGVIFSISSLIKVKISNVIIRVVPDFIAFLIISVLYVLYAHKLYFPNFRLYMPIGVIVGIIIYFKSFHILLANCVKKLYNLNIKKIRNKRKDGRIKS